MTAEVKRVMEQMNTRIQALENGMTSGGNIVEGIMQRVDGMLGEVRDKMDQLSQEDAKIKRNIQEVFDAGKQDMATMITEQVKMEKESREVCGYNNHRATKLDTKHGKEIQ